MYQHFFFNVFYQANKMAQLVKVLATNSNNLNSLFETMWKEKPSFRKWSFDLYVF